MPGVMLKAHTCLISTPGPIAFISPAPLFLEVTLTTITTYPESGQLCCPCSGTKSFQNFSATTRDTERVRDPHRCLPCSHIWTQVEKSTSSFWNWVSVILNWSELIFSLPWGEKVCFPHTGWGKQHLNLQIQPVMPEAWTTSRLNRYPSHVWLVLI